MPHAPVNELSMYYEVHGEGPPLVLLHGAYMTADMMTPLATGLAEYRQVIVPEAQAHARTADVDRPLSYEQMGDDVADLIRHLGFEQADVVGYSMGGGAALQLAIRHPALVRRLVIASAGFRYDATPPMLASQRRLAMLPPRSSPVDVLAARWRRGVPAASLRPGAQQAGRVETLDDHAERRAQARWARSRSGRSSASISARALAERVSRAGARHQHGVDAASRGEDVSSGAAAIASRPPRRCRAWRADHGVEQRRLVREREVDGRLRHARRLRDGAELVRALPSREPLLGARADALARRRRGAPGDSRRSFV